MVAANRAKLSLEELRLPSAARVKQWRREFAGQCVVACGDLLVAAHASERKARREAEIKAHQDASLDVRQFTFLQC